MHSFSIIIPFKTGKQYLLDCIQSVLAQSYSNYQIIVLTDNTSNQDGAIDAVLALGQHKIEIIGSQENLDILGNWARIKEVSKSDYMTILGYDDILYPNFLATINELIHKHPNASLYHTHFNYINKDGAIISACKPLPEQLSSAEYLEMALQDQISIMATGYVFKTADYTKLGGIDTHYPNLIYADLQLWIDLAQIGYLATSSKTAFAFRIHASTTKISKDKILMDALLVFLNYLKKLASISNEYQTVIKQHTGPFLEQTTKSIAHRLLRTAPANRQGLRIKDLAHNLKGRAVELGVEYHPEKIKSFQIAVLIEKSKLLTSLFLFFKSIYKKPIY